MAQPFPTRREFVLVVLLFSFLFFLNLTREFKPPPSTNPSLWNTSHVSQKEPPMHTQTRLSWKSHLVPQTKLIAHVPGVRSHIAGSSVAMQLLTPDQDGRFWTDCISSTASYISFLMTKSHYPMCRSFFQEGSPLNRGRRQKFLDFRQTMIFKLLPHKRLDSYLERVHPL